MQTYPEPFSTTVPQPARLPDGALARLGEAQKGLDEALSVLEQKLGPVFGMQLAQAPSSPDVPTPPQSAIHSAAARLEDQVRWLNSITARVEV